MQQTESEGEEKKNGDNDHNRLSRRTQLGETSESVCDRIFPMLCFPGVSGAPPEVSEGNLNLAFAIRIAEKVS